MTLSPPGQARAQPGSDDEPRRVASGNGNRLAPVAASRLRDSSTEASIIRVVQPGQISIDDPRRPDVRRLLERHLTFARSKVPPEDAHALDLDDLLDPSVTFFSLRADGQLLAVGALKQLDSDHAEVKSMHTAQIARRSGAGRSMIEHLSRICDLLRPWVERPTWAETQSATGGNDD